MKPQFLIIAILIILKVIGVASRANADVNPCFNQNTDYGYGYNSEGLNEHGQKSILRFAEESECNEYQKNIIDNVLINLKTKKLINNYTNPVYRCGNSPSIKRI